MPLLLLPPPPEFVNVKVILIGNSAVGKSSLLLRFCDRQWFPEERAMPTIGVDFRVSRMEVNGQKVKINIWDTAGQERFRTITASYYRGAQGVVLVYDVSNRESFRGISRWLEELEDHAQSDIVKILVGNKVDMESSRVVSTEEGAGFAARNGCLFVEASAKTAEGVTEAFSDVVGRIIDTPSLWREDRDHNPTNVDGPYPDEGYVGNIDLSAITNLYGSRWCRC